MAAKQVAEKLISEHLIAIFSKSYCPYCSQAKSVIDKLGLDKSKVGILELDTMGSEGSDIQSYLQEKTNQRTVPNIFINQKHLGGCSDLLDAQKSGKLQQLLK
ncbi:probable GRX1 - glutaredoxin [Ustilago trichophora]|uniref:glutathione peroxidase n=1 Tax=Ustilago trichophora TaxID=86804 RepID=A0A5C3E0L7_9BASI|nr:probable GRX1 - glutaredoxin [Ustilago trichophora]